MRFVSFLIEGIVGRTSQREPRINNAIDIIAKALADNYDFDPKTKIMSPRPVAIIGDLGELFDHVIDKMHDGKKPFDQSQKFGIKPKYKNAFMSAILFLSREYITQIGDVSAEHWDTAVTDASNWYTNMLKQLENKYEAYRTS